MAVHPENRHMQSRCPYYDCLRIIDLEVDNQGDAPPDLMRPERGRCPYCDRPASFRELGLVTKCDRLFEQRQPGEPVDWDIAAASVLLEDVRSLGNVGSIFRTADGAGVGKIYLCGFTGCPPRKQIAKTSLGAEDEIAWHYLVGIGQILPKLKDRGVFIIGLEKTDNSEELYGALQSRQISAPWCLVVGNEVTGLSEEALHFCDVVCHLPMRGSKESLNVAVAFGIAAYAISDQVGSD